MRRAHVWLAAIVASLAWSASARADPVLLPGTWGPTGGAVNALTVAGHDAFLGGDFRGVGPDTGGLTAVSPTTGLLDTTAHSGAWRATATTAVLADGSGGVYAAGDFTLDDGAPLHGVVHVRSNGTLDHAFAPRMDSAGRIDALALVGTTLYAGGSFQGVNGTVLGSARLVALNTADGAIRTAFSAGVDGTVDALTVGGTPGTPVLYVGGKFAHAGGVPHQNIAALDPTAGTSIASFAALTDNEVDAIAVGPASSGVTPVYLGGSFTDVDLNARYGMAAVSAANGHVLAFNPKIFGQVLTIVPTASIVYAGGSFTGFGTPHGPGPQGLASLDPATGAVKNFSSANNPFLSGSLVTSIVAKSDDDVLVAGQFPGLGPETSLVPRSGVAELTPSTGAVGPWDPAPNAGPSEYVAGLAMSGGRVFVAGDYTALAAVHRARVAEIDLDSGRPTPLDPNVDGPVAALAVKGDTLYVGGDFHTVGSGTPRRSAAAFSISGGGAVTPFDPQLVGTSAAQTTISAIDASGNAVLIGGRFASVRGQPRTALAEVDAFAGSPTAFAPQLPGSGAFVSALRRTYTNHFVAAGGFDNGIVSIAEDGSTTGTLDPFATAAVAGSVTGVDYANGVVYVSGTFAELGATPRNGVGALDAGSGALLPFAPAIGGPPAPIAAAKRLGSREFVAGSLTDVGGQSRPGLAAVDPITGGLDPWRPTLGFGINPAVSVLDGTPEIGLVGASNANGVITADGSPRNGVVHYAIEPTAPTAPQATAGTGSATVTFTPPAATGGLPVTGYTVTATPGGKTASGSAAPIQVGGLTPGTTYHFTVTARNAAGTGPASEQSNAVVPTQPAEGGSGGGGGGPSGGGGPGSGGGDSGPSGAAPPGGSSAPPPTTPSTPPGTAPGGPLASVTAAKLALSAVSLTHARFRVSERHSRVPRGTKVRFTLSRAATVTFTVTHRVKDARHHRTRTVTDFVVKHDKLVRGTHSVTFSGRAGRHVLRPGRYSLAVSAAAGSDRSSTVTRGFTVVHG